MLEKLLIVFSNQNAIGTELFVRKKEGKLKGKNKKSNDKTKTFEFKMIVMKVLHNRKVNSIFSVFVGLSTL